MTQRAPVAHFGLKYDAFLFASLGDDRNGIPLAIASLLGRLNLDPWQEAASLAALPAEAATRKLASFIEALPGQPLRHPESAALAARLITLLPDAGKSDLQAAGPQASPGAKPGRRPVNYLLWFAILCVLLLGAALANATPGRLPALTFNLSSGAGR